MGWSGTIVNSALRPCFFCSVNNLLTSHTSSAVLLWSCAQRSCDWGEFFVNQETPFLCSLHLSLWSPSLPSPGIPEQLPAHCGSARSWQICSLLIFSIATMYEQIPWSYFVNCIHYYYVDIMPPLSCLVR